MRIEERRFHTYDSSLNIWGCTPTTDLSILEADWRTYGKVIQLLRQEGFRVTLDRSVHQRIRKHYHAGRRGDVLFASEAHGVHCKFEFYEDVIRDNKAGGRYHFDKMAKAPYLWRLKVTLLHRKIGGLLHSLGFKDRTDEKPRDAFHEMQLHRTSLEAFHGPRLWADMRHNYNVEDGEGREIKDGEKRWFYERNGRLMRGECWHHINNMWWVIVDRYDLRNIAAFDLFTYDAAKHPRKWSPHPIQNLSRALERVIKAKNYRKAAVMSDALGRMVDSYEFKDGDRVVVDNTRYRGPGIVDHVDPPFKVWVKLPNDNTWAYEWATVRPAPKEVHAGAV
jgi:hypothetical protein